MNALANILLVIFFASVLYGAIFSQPKDARSSLREAPRSPEGGGGEPARPRPLPRRHVRLIAEGTRAGWEAHGAVHKYR